MAATKFENDVVMYACSMGKVFRVTHICDTDAEANAVMEKVPDTALICMDNKKRLYLARQYGSIAPSSILKDLKGDWI
jgi:hypothetical protein